MGQRAIVSLYDHTGRWSQPYRDLGYEVAQFDLQNDGLDVRLLKAQDFPPASRVVGVLAAPPCTVFANSGARWPRTDADMVEGLSMVDAVLRIVHLLKPDWWALENPIGKLKHYLGEPLLRFNPNEYAGFADNPRDDQYTKKTCLWGDFNANLPRAELDAVDGSKLWANYGGKSERTKNARSATPQGFARAFCEANR